MDLRQAVILTLEKLLLLIVTSVKRVTAEHLLVVLADVLPVELALIKTVLRTHIVLFVIPILLIAVEFRQVLVPLALLVTLLRDHAHPVLSAHTRVVTLAHPVTQAIPQQPLPHRR